MQSAASGASSYIWTLDEGGGNYTVVNTSNNSVGLTFSVNYPCQVRCQATNICGLGGITFINVMSGYKSPSNSGTNIYPNPVGDILYIDIDPPSDVKTQTAFDARLYDGQGNLLRQAFTMGGTVEFNVSKLTEGLYFLHIYDGGNLKPEIHQVMVER